MESQQESEWVVPNPQIPRTFGLMNIIFGVILLLVGAGYVAWLFVAPTFTRKMQANLQQQQAAQKAKRAAQIADLKTKEAAAKTKEERKALQDERAAVESQPEPDLAAFEDLTGWNILSDVRLAAYYIAEVGSGMLLNLLMIIAGGGLMALAEWGRRLALGVAWLKIVRWVAMVIVTLALILPITTERMQKAFAKMDAQIQAKSGAAAAPVRMTDMARISAIASAVMIVVMAVIACIYPALSLWFLTRPRARAACLAAAKPAPREEPTEWS